MYRSHAARTEAALRGISSQQGNNLFVQFANACAGRIAVFKRTIMKAGFAFNMTSRVAFRHNGRSFYFEVKLPVREGMSGFVVGSGKRGCFHFTNSGSCLIARVKVASSLCVYRSLISSLRCPANSFAMLWLVPVIFKSETNV